MDNVYNSLINSFEGQDAHELVASLAKVLCDEPTTLGDPDADVHDHQFKDSGICLVCESNRVNMVIFAIRASKNQQSESNVSATYYRGQLPQGILPTDSRAEIKAKFNIEPMVLWLGEPDEACDKYRIGPFTFVLMFDDLTDQLLTLAIQKSR
jgi:hypothetical protein